MNDRWTLSRWIIWPTADGDQEEEAYSSMGRTYVLKARVMIDGFFERKQRRDADRFPAKWIGSSRSSASVCLTTSSCLSRRCRPSPGNHWASTSRTFRHAHLTVVSVAMHTYSRAPTLWPGFRRCTEGTRVDQGRFLKAHQKVTQRQRRSYHWNDLLSSVIQKRCQPR